MEEKRLVWEKPEAEILSFSDTDIIRTSTKIVISDAGAGDSFDAGDWF